MPHAGELLSIVGTLRGEGPVSKVNNSLVVVSEYLTDELGLTLVDENSNGLTD
jgi:hypothetical protein